METPETDIDKLYSDPTKAESEEEEGGSTFARDAGLAALALAIAAIANPSFSVAGWEVPEELPVVLGAGLVFGAVKAFRRTRSDERLAYDQLAELQAEAEQASAANPPRSE